MVTLWDIGGPQDFMHDEIATDKNNPTVNAYGPIYAVSAGHGTLNVVDPVTNDAYKVVIPTREDPRKVSHALSAAARPSNFWGMEHLWGQEQSGRSAQPHDGSSAAACGTPPRSATSSRRSASRAAHNKFAQYYPLTSSNRQASVYDPATGKFELIDTCFAHASPAVRHRRGPHAVLQRADRPDVRLDQHAAVRSDP